MASIDQSPVVRSASLDDAVSIAELGTRVFTVTFGHSVPPHELQAYLDDSYSVSAITKDLEDETKDTIVATDPGGNLLGFAILARGSTEPCVDHVEDKVELLRIYVNSSQHGKGIGKLLYNSIETMARDQGFKHIWLGVWEENFKAQKVYKAWGYGEVGDHEFVIGSVVQRDLIMMKSL
ncbi:acyl-CoA N-acyltransferase [Thozetella sp. PMI_491]|nr:acyl-CoA N-acyltransferase [Thozetella sp. PMI_491]